MAPCDVDCNCSSHQSISQCALYKRVSVYVHDPEFVHVYTGESRLYVRRRGGGGEGRRGGVDGG